MSVITTISQNVILFIDKEMAIKIEESPNAINMAKKYNITIEERLLEINGKHCLILHNGKPFVTEVSEVNGFRDIKNLKIDDAFYGKAIELINEYKSMFNLGERLSFSPDAQVRLLFL